MIILSLRLTCELSFPLAVGHRWRIRWASSCNHFRTYVYMAPSPSLLRKRSFLLRQGRVIIPWEERVIVVAARHGV